MSLRLQLVLLFTAVLAATLLVASALGLRIGQRSVEDEIRKRTAELASATTLALKHAGQDQRRRDRLHALARSRDPRDRRGDRRYGDRPRAACGRPVQRWSRRKGAVGAARLAGRG